jgi:Ca2+-binding RTX toxin-like protein
MTRTTRPIRLHVEALERRDTPAVGADGVGEAPSVTVFGDLTGPADAVTLDFNAAGQFVITLNGQSEPFDPDEVNEVLLYLGEGTNTVTVEGVPANAHVIISSDGADTVDLSPTARDLDNVRGLVTFKDGSTDDTVILYDQAHTPRAEYDLGYGNVRSSGSDRTFGGLDYTHDGQEIRLHVSDAGASVDVTAGPVVGTTKVFGGAGDDTFAFRFDTGQRAGYLGRYEVTGNGIWDAVTIDVTALRGGLNDYGIDGSAIALNDRPSAADPFVDRLDVTFASVGSVCLSSDGDPSTFRLAADPWVPMTIEGGAGEDALRGAPQTNTWTLAGATDSRVGDVTFGSIEHLRGGTWADQFVFQPGGRVWNSLDGGNGTDTLDYSALGAGVTVDLGTGSAPQVASPVTTVENVTGTAFPDTLTGDARANQLRGLAGNDTLSGGLGNELIWAGGGADRVSGGDHDDVLYGEIGNDRLDGNAGNDVLFGQAGIDNLTGGADRDILFGGSDPDTVDGGEADDIVASGSLRFEEVLSQVNAIWAEWTSTHTYADRVANLRGRAADSTTWGSRRNGNSFLTVKGTVPTVLNGSSAQDRLTGGPAKAPDSNQDWFFGLSAEFLDRQANEEANG